MLSGAHRADPCHHIFSCQLIPETAKSSASCAASWRNWACLGHSSACNIREGLSHWHQSHTLLFSINKSRVSLRGLIDYKSTSGLLRYWLRWKRMKISRINKRKLQAENLSYSKTVLCLFSQLCGLKSRWGPYHFLSLMRSKNAWALHTLSIACLHWLGQPFWQHLFWISWAVWGAEDSSAKGRRAVKTGQRTEQVRALLKIIIVNVESTGFQKKVFLNRL